VWVNLGSLNLRLGDVRAAEAAWQHAVALNPREYPAISNLERLYEEQQRRALASALRRRIIEYRQQNPYYRFHLAEAAVKRRDWDAAIAHLRFAVAKKPTDDRFLALLGVAYLQRGDARAASRWIARAAEVAATDERRRRYQSKLDLLRKGAT
jgi:Flp pilus assembly protein TadD